MKKRIGIFVFYVMGIIDVLSAEIMSSALNANNGNTIRTMQRGKVYVEASPERFTYDDNGNLTSDGRWNYAWNAENRLIGIETNAEAAKVGVPQEKYVYTYDWCGRKVKSESYKNTNGTWNLISTNKRYYDNYNLIYETTEYTDGRATDVKKYYYGTDLLGSVYGSAGTGGLRMIDINGEVCYVFNNQVGSIEALYGADTDNATQTKAEYTYSAYGEIMMKSGDLADKNNITYSTRYQEANTGLVSYTYRHYSPRLKKWLSKDPISESGGLNLYQMVNNNPVNYWDQLGFLTGNVGDPKIRATIKSYIKNVSKYPCLGIIVVAHGIEGKHQYFGIPGTANEVLNDLQSFALKNGRTPTNLGLGAVSCNDVLSNQAAGKFGYPNANRTDKARNNMPFNIHVYFGKDPDNLREALSKEIKALKTHTKNNMCNKEPNCCNKINIKIFTIIIDQGNFLDNLMDAINYFNRNYPFLKDNYEYKCNEL